jgi:hypothetical protein
MMAPLPPSNLPADRPELPRVRLDVRSGSGRPISYEVGTDEFLIGGASGCDLRLPAPNLPPVICQLTRKVDGVRLRKVAPNVPILLNDAALSANTPTPVNSGDKLSLSGFDITIAIQHPDIIVPRFTPIEEKSEGAAEPTPITPPDRT